MQRKRPMRRSQRLAIIGAVMILFSVLGTVALFYGAYRMDKARGITVDQSLRSAGL